LVRLRFGVNHLAGRRRDKPGAASETQPCLKFDDAAGKSRRGAPLGIDSHGELIILENIRGDRKDPFEDLVEYAKNNHAETTANNSRDKWEAQYQAEKRHDKPLAGRKPWQGILPRSSHTKPLKRWSNRLFSNVGAELSEQVKTLHLAKQ
jgi:hypothetical protein